VRVVDGVYGGPAAGVCIRLLTETEGIKTERLRQYTDSEGCMVAELSASLAPGLGRLVLDINGYFATLGVSPFYPDVTVSFRLSNSISAYKIIIIVTPSTYAVFKGNWNGGNAQAIGG
jgi:5-hydroxyisourate hydrolase